MELIEQFSSYDKQIFLASLPIISKNIEFFIIRFYHYLMKTETGQLFEHADFSKQYRMFQTSLNVILTHITDTTLLDDYLLNIIKKHRAYGVLVRHTDYFTDSFMNALEEIFTDEEDYQILDVWRKVISEIMTYFKNHLST